MRYFKINRRLVFSTALILTSITAFSQVGIGTANPNENAILDLTATNKALVLPRVANTAAIPSPINGMMIFDISSNCVKSYENGAWTDCLSSTENATSSLTANCGGTNGFNGTFVPGAAANAAGPTTFKVTLQNNTFFVASVTPVIGDLDLGGSSLSVISVSPNTVQNITGGGSLVITYTLGGTVPASGIVTGTFSKLSITCSNTLDLDLAPTQISKTLYNGCSQSFTNPGSLVLSSSNTAVATLTGNNVLGTGNSGTAIISGPVPSTNYSLGRVLTSNQRVFIYNSGSGSHSLAGATDVVSFTAEAWGGGGGGGSSLGCFGSCAGAGSGGGGGAFSQTTNVSITTPTPGSISYSVGGAGAGGVGTSMTNGAAGGNSTISYTGLSINAGGGSGGFLGSALNLNPAGGAGGLATGGAFNQSGSAGGNGANINTTNAVGGAGGNSGGVPSGAGGNSITSGSSAGNPGSAPGGGGGGARSSSAANGGAGGAGRVVITYTCPL